MEDVGPFLSGVGSLVKNDAEKTELLNAAFASVFTSKPALRNPRHLRPGESLEQGWLGGGPGEGLLKQTGHTQTQGTWCDASMSAEKGQLPLKGHDGWGRFPRAGRRQIFKKGKKDWAKYRPVGLTSIPGKVIEQIVLVTFSKLIKDRKMIENIHHGFTKGKSVLTDLIAFYNKITSLVVEWRALDVV